MQNQIIDQFTTTSTKSYETMINLSEINSSAIQKLTDLQFDFISMSMEAGIDQAKSLNSMRNIKDVFAVGSEFASEYNEKLMGITHQAVEILSESCNEATKLIEKTVVSPVVSSKQAPSKKPVKSAATKGTTKSTAKKSV